MFRAVLGEVGLRNDPTTRSFLVNNEHAPNLLVFHKLAAFVDAGFWFDGDDRSRPRRRMAALIPSRIAAAVRAARSMASLRRTSSRVAMPAAAEMGAAL